MNTHEAFIHAVRDIVADRANGSKSRIMGAKLTYGAGTGHYRGICYSDAWNNGNDKVDFVEISASGEESTTQLAGTTIHELGHVLAGCQAGHGKDWKNACKQLGLRIAKQAGQRYLNAHFDPAIRARIIALSNPKDGNPLFRGMRQGPLSKGLPIGSVRPCPIGIGTRGGKSRGAGSGSRLRLYTCKCNTKVRVASDTFKAHCDTCTEPFNLVVKD